MQNEIETITELLRVAKLIGKCPSVIDGFMEGDIIEIMDLLAKHNFNKYFEHLCKCIQKSPLESFSEINSYVLSRVKSGEHKKNFYTVFHIVTLEKYR